MLQLGNYALGDTPLALTPLIPILAGYLLLRHCRKLVDTPRRSDEFLDAFIFFILFVGCCALIFYLPVHLSWYYWILRLDLLVVPAFASAVVILLWGLSGFAILWRPLLYLLLVWPFPLVLLHRTVAPFLANATALFGSLVVRFLGLPYTVPAESPNHFVSTGQQQFTIIISDVCSGMNAAMGFLVVGLPLAILWSGSKKSKVAWLAAGTLVASLSNLLRVSILLVLSATSGVDFALGTVHSALGLALFVVVFAGMLALAKAFGLQFAGAKTAPFPFPRLGRSEGFPLGLATVALAVAVLALGQIGLSRFALLSSDSTQTVVVQEPAALLPDVPGWSRVEEEEIHWQNLFGADSQSRLVVYRAGEASMVVQFVSTTDQNTLETYTPEQCSLYHGERIIGICGVDLGHGISARLVESRLKRDGDQPEINGATLYWLMPFTVGDRQYHARIALLADEEMMVEATASRGHTSNSPSQRFHNWLNSTFSLYPPAPSQPEFAQLDAYAIAFGRQMVEAIIRSPLASN